MSASKYFKEDEQQKSGRSDLKNIKIFCPSDSPQYICRSLWHQTDIFTTAPPLLQICTSSCGQVSFILTSFDFCIAESSVLNAQGFVEPSNVWQCCPCLICAPHIWPHLAPVEVVFLHFTSQAKGQRALQYDLCCLDAVKLAARVQNCSNSISIASIQYQLLQFNMKRDFHRNITGPISSKFWQTNWDP